MPTIGCRICWATAAWHPIMVGATDTHRYGHTPSSRSGVRRRSTLLDIHGVGCKAWLVRVCVAGILVDVVSRAGERELCVFPVRVCFLHRPICPAPHCFQFPCMSVIFRRCPHIFWSCWPMSRLPFPRCVCVCVRVWIVRSSPLISADVRASPFVICRWLAVSLCRPTCWVAQSTILHQCRPMIEPVGFHQELCVAGPPLRAYQEGVSKPILVVMRQTTREHTADAPTMCTRLAKARATVIKHMSSCLAESPAATLELGNHC